MRTMVCCALYSLLPGGPGTVPADLRRVDMDRVRRRRIDQVPPIPRPCLQYGFAFLEIHSDIRQIPGGFDGRIVPLSGLSNMVAAPHQPARNVSGETSEVWFGSKLTSDQMSGIVKGFRMPAARRREGRHGGQASQKPRCRISKAGSR